MAEIKFSPEAIKDLQQTKAYITEELCNEQAAVGTVAKITKRIIQRFIESKIRQHILSVCYTDGGTLCKSCSESQAITEYNSKETNRHLKKVAIFLCQKKGAFNGSKN